MAQIFRLKKSYVPVRGGSVGNSVKDPVNSFSTAKSKPAGICFVEVGNKDTRGLMSCTYCVLQRRELLAGLTNLLDTWSAGYR